MTDKIASEMARFFDSSALVKAYHREDGSDAVRRLLGDGEVVVSHLTVAEIASALGRRVREGGLYAADRDLAVAALETNLADYRVVPVSRVVVRRACGLLAAHRLRAADAIQLASCLWLREQLGDLDDMVVYDDRLAVAARAEGLATLAPRES